MGRKYILASTLTWHFIYFAKVMGIYTKLHSIYKKLCDVLEEADAYPDDDIFFFSKGSFERYVDLYLHHHEIKYLNEYFIKTVYFYGAFAENEFKNVGEIIDLFFSYLKEKKIYRNIRIERG